MNLLEDYKIGIKYVVFIQVIQHNKVDNFFQSKDNKFIASGSTDGKICIFDEAQGKLIHTAHTQNVRSIEISPNNKLVVTASNDGFVKLFNV